MVRDDTTDEADGVGVAYSPSAVSAHAVSVRYGREHGSVAQQAERPQQSGGCGFEARRNPCASTSPTPIRFTIFPTGMGAMAARRTPLSQPKTRQCAPS